MARLAMSDHEFDQPPTLHYTTLCPVVSVVVGVHNKLDRYIWQIILGKMVSCCKIKHIGGCYLVNGCFLLVM